MNSNFINTFVLDPNVDSPLNPQAATLWKTPTGLKPVTFYDS